MITDCLLQFKITLCCHFAIFTAVSIRCTKCICTGSLSGVVRVIGVLRPEAAGPISTKDRIDSFRIFAKRPLFFTHIDMAFRSEHPKAKDVCIGGVL